MEAFTVLDCVGYIGLGFLLAGLLFYPLAVIMAVIKGFKSN